MTRGLEPPAPAPRTTDPDGPAPVEVDGGARLVDVVFTLAVLATMAYWWRLTPTTWFFVDEWQLALRGDSLGDFLEPYNGHLSIIYLALYRVTFELFGFDHYGAFRLLGFASLASVPLTLYLTTRRAIGTTLAALGGVSFLWFTGMSLEPGGLNHPLCVTAGILAAHHLPRPGRRADVAVALFLTAALTVAGGGVAVAVGCVVFVAVTRAPSRRVVAVLVPCAAWAIWWLIWGRDAGLPAAVRLSVAEMFEAAARGLYHSFAGLALGSDLGGVVLMAVFVALVATQLRAGIAASGSTIGWTVAAVAWWVGLAQSRGQLAAPETFRYQFVAAAFLVLAVVPPLSTLVRRRPLPSWSPIVVVPLAACIALANVDGVRESGQLLRAYGAQARVVATVAGSDPSVLPPETVLGFGFAYLTQAEYTVISERYGVPATAPRSRLDAEMLTMNLPRIDVMPRADGGGCEPVPAELSVPAGQPLRLRTGNRPVDLAVRRFGDRRVVIQRVSPQRDVTLVFIPDVGLRPWSVVAEGACRVPG